jgi:trk system potassium uptake protein TrkA
MKIILAGGKKITYYLAKNLISKGMAVTIINKDKAYCEEISKNLKALIIYGDPSNLTVLKKAEIFSEDIVVALATRDQDNLIICELAARVLKVEKVFALVNDSENAQVFKKLGLPNIINMTEIFSGVIEQRLSSFPITNLMPFEEGKVLIIQLELEEGFPIIGKMLKDIELPEGALIATINRRDKVFVPHGDASLEQGDRLLIICLPVDQTQTLRIIAGQE